MLYISAKIHEIISNGIEVMEWTHISIGKITKGNNSAKMQVEQLSLISACCLSCFMFLPSFVKLSRTVSK